MSGKPKAPAGLGPAGRRLWGRLQAELELEPDELALLELAARQADDVAALEAAVAEEGLIVLGAAGQRRLNAAVPELRQARLAVGRLLGMIRLPDAEGRPVTLGTVQARKAAAARWRPARLEVERREAAVRREGHGPA